MFRPPKNIHKIFIPPKNIHLSENAKKIWKLKFWIQKNGPSLRMYENIRVPPPPPHTPLGLRHVLEYEGKTENILENIFCIETVWTSKIFDLVMEAHSGPLRCVPVHSG